AFAAVAEVPTAVANILSQITFPAGPRTCVVQDESDEGFLRRVLVQYDFLQTQPALRGLLLTGIFAPPKKPGLRLTWGGAAAYRPPKQGEARGGQRGAGRAPITVGSGSCPAGVTVIRALLDRPFVPGDFTAWAARELPLFLQGAGALVGGVEDRLFQN